MASVEHGILSMFYQTYFKIHSLARWAVNVHAVAEKPHDAVVEFDTYRNVQRHRVVLPAIARPLFAICYQLQQILHIMSLEQWWSDGPNNDLRKFFPKLDFLLLWRYHGENSVKLGRVALVAARYVMLCNNWVKQNVGQCQGGRKNIRKQNDISHFQFDCWICVTSLFSHHKMN